MENKMKYPYIGELLSGAGGVAVFLNDYTAAPLNDSGDNWRESEIFTYSCDFHSPSFKNITHEYLANTYGEVLSPEHAEFIIELAELHGYKCGNFSTNKDGYFFTDGEWIRFTDSEFHANNDGEKQITIPLPPKADNQDLSEWPCVGSVVTWGNKSVKGEVKALSDGLAWIKNEYGNYCSEYVSSLQKPKTPAEELRDDIVNLINYAGSFSAQIIAGALMSKYEMKKKPQ